MNLYVKAKIRLEIVVFFGNTDSPHQLFKVEVKGRATTGLSACIKAKARHQISMFRYQTAYTKPENELEKMFSSIDFSGCDTNWKKSMRIMEKVYQTLSYVKSATTVETSAEQALQLGQGVCQDYAHIMISLCRMAGIPSRYVVGMLIGEGLSHAWVEIENNGYWYGLDLTNFLVVNDQHIKISMGEIIKIV